MKEQVLKIILENDWHDGDQKVAEEIESMFLAFIEWAATTHIKLHKVWCGLYKDQRNEANWKTTDELFQFWITNIKK